MYELLFSGIELVEHTQHVKHLFVLYSDTLSLYLNIRMKIQIHLNILFSMNTLHFHLKNVQWGLIIKKCCFYHDTDLLIK